MAYVDVLIFSRIIYFVPAVLLHCWLGIRKSIRPVKIEWWGVGVANCLERGADCLHMVQLMPLHPKTPSSPGSLKSRLVLPSGTCLPRLSWPSSSHMIYLWAASWPEYVCFLLQWVLIGNNEGHTGQEHVGSSVCCARLGFTDVRVSLINRVLCSVRWQCMVGHLLRQAGRTDIHWIGKLRFYSVTWLGLVLVAGENLSYKWNCYYSLHYCYLSSLSLYASLLLI